MIKLLNWTGVRPLTNKSSVLFLKRFFGVTIIVLTLSNTVFARYADNEEKEKPGKPGAKKDSTDSATAPPRTASPHRHSCWSGPR